MPKVTANCSVKTIPISEMKVGDFGIVVNPNGKG